MTGHRRQRSKDPRLSERRATGGEDVARCAGVRAWRRPVRAPRAGVPAA